LQHEQEQAHLYGLHFGRFNSIGQKTWWRGHDIDAPLDARGYQCITL
jgi:hypothetical protein